MRIFLPLLFSWFLCILECKAQDPNFSQFFSSPLTLNPANIGNFDGTLRISSNYRNQWPGFNNAYITSTLAADGSIFENKISQNDRIGWGGLLMTDASGNGVLSQQSALIGLSYSKGLDENRNHVLNLGFQASYLNLRFNSDKANFEDELSPTGFDLQTAENFFLNGNRRSMFDFHSGIQYVGKLNENQLIYLGLGVYHLARPKSGLLNLRYLTPMRYNLNTGGFTSLDQRNSIHYNVQLQKQGSFKEYIYGAAWNRILNEQQNRSIQGYLGIWIRNNEYTIPYMGLEWNGFRMGFSYDIGISSKKSASTQYQSAEVSLIWIKGKETNINNLQCPKF
jgi:type IX secretion system PorP/SprF family membrane protein